MCSPGRLLLKVILCGASELSIPSGTTKRLLALLGFELGPLAFVEPLSSFKPGKQKEPRASVAWIAGGRGGHGQ